ncbi:MAG: valine--tRNA ligase, partial [Chitinophagaceae bacterium]
ALSDEEVIRKEIQQQLYHIQYLTVNEQGETTGNITIATVRPETIMGDTAICVHPNDTRYQHLHGQYAIVPLINRRIPIITDEYVAMDFGTGALKVTPAHDMNDYQLGQKHQLEIVDVLNDDGTLSEAAQIYVGLDRFEARKKIAAELQEKGYLIKTETYTSEVGHSERSDAVVEPRLSLQWWVKMEPLATKALEVVMSDEVSFVPAKFKNLYRHWMENIKDWCISRQLWWGHRIPAWYDEKGNYVVANNETEAYQKYAATYGNTNVTLQQDEDCLDTWFSSWLWPFEVFKGYSNPNNPDINYYYPTATLVTAPEIIFFWVARMIMAGLEYQQQIPFKHVYFTGIVRDKLGRKMSKSLGNSPDLLGLIDQYGADAVRFGIMIASPAGNDILFDEASLEQGRNFNNKLWNALKLVKMWEAKLGTTNDSDNNAAQFATAWFEHRLQQTKAEVYNLMDQFKLSEALKTIYSLIWDDFCSWYLEWVKPGYEQPMNAAIYQKTIGFFDELMAILHPFMPFITEEIYHQLQERANDICVSQIQAPKPVDSSIVAAGELLKQVITQLRDARNKNQLKPKDTIELSVQTQAAATYQQIAGILQKQVNAVSFTVVDAPTPSAIVVAVEQDKFYLKSNAAVDTNALKAELEKDLAYQKGFLESVMKKLSNERFMANAKPDVIANEEKKKADAEARIKTIEESLATLSA